MLVLRYLSSFIYNMNIKCSSKLNGIGHRWTSEDFGLVRASDFLWIGLGLVHRTFTRNRFLNQCRGRTFYLEREEKKEIISLIIKHIN